MLLVVPATETPHWEAPKPMVRGYGCRDVGHAVVCEFVIVSGEMTPGTTRVRLHRVARPQREIVVEWPERYARVGGYPKLHDDIQTVVLPRATEEE